MQPLPVVERTLESLDDGKRLHVEKAHDTTSAGHDRS